MQAAYKKHHIIYPTYCQCAQGSQYHVHLLDLYTEEVTTCGTFQEPFYIWPLNIVLKDPDAPWYCSTPVGSHTLSKKAKGMCERQGFKDIRRIIAYVCATGASNMYEAEVPESLVQEQTGHRYLRVYEHSAKYNRLFLLYWDAYRPLPFMSR